MNLVLLNSMSMVPLCYNKTYTCHGGLIDLFLKTCIFAQKNFFLQNCVFQTCSFFEHKTKYVTCMKKKLYIHILQTYRTCLPRLYVKWRWYQHSKKYMWHVDIWYMIYSQMKRCGPCYIFWLLKTKHDKKYDAYDTSFKWECKLVENVWCMWHEFCLSWLTTQSMANLGSDIHVNKLVHIKELLLVGPEHSLFKIFWYWML